MQVLAPNAFVAVKSSFESCWRPTSSHFSLHQAPDRSPQTPSAKPDNAFLREHHQGSPTAYLDSTAIFGAGIVPAIARQSWTPYWILI